MNSPPISTAAPKVQISWGELVDKLTILEIKLERLKSNDAIENVRRELTTLSGIASEVLSGQPKVVVIKEQLKSLNEILWEIEDKIRAKEATKSFDRQFIELARSVYMTNDKRGDLKRQINALLNSDFVEE